MKMHGSKLYTIEYLPTVTKKDIPNLPKIIKATIKKAIEERLMHDPIRFGKPLQYSLKGHRRLRVSDYRIIYRIKPNTKMVLIIAIKHRKNIYKEFDNT